MKHSKRMSKGEQPLTTDAIPRHLDKLPLVNRYAVVAQFSSLNNAFTNAVNQWTTDRVVALHLQQKFNCSGVGLWMNDDNTVFFTLIMGLRSHIGSSLYTGSTLRSVLLAEKCLDLVNCIRTHEFGLLAFGIDLRLCDLAYRYTEFTYEQLTPEYLEETIGHCADHQVAFGAIPAKRISPQLIVEDWMNQMGKEKNVLGDFNRVGFGFQLDDKTGTLKSIGIYVRSIRAAIVDGSESVVDGSVLAGQVAEMLNEFREQHSLQPLNYDADLCQIALEHSEYVANGSEGPNPLDVDPFVNEIEPKYTATDISHMHCTEISRAPKTFMEKWRNNVDCISVILNQIDDIGVGVCFDEDYNCHITVIVGSFGNESDVMNIIYRL
jgi:uncharacterized protein YkwD